jgi:hypothetical protein
MSPIHEHADVHKFDIKSDNLTYSVSSTTNYAEK